MNTPLPAAAVHVRHPFLPIGEIAQHTAGRCYRMAGYAAALCFASVLTIAWPQLAVAQSAPPEAAAEPSAAAQAQDAKPTAEAQDTPSTEAASDSSQDQAEPADPPDSTQNVAGAAAPPEPLDETGRMLRALDSADATERNAGTEWLMAMEGVKVERLEEALSAADSVEVQHRLMRILRHRAVRSMFAEIENREGGSLGVRYEPAPAHTVAHQRQPGVRIVLTLPGFPAHEKLRAGDVILTINGEPLSRRNPSTDFANSISGHPPGEPLEIEFVRSGAHERVTLPLAPRQALQRVYSSRRPTTLNGVYLERLTQREADLRERAQPPQSISVPPSVEPLGKR